MGVVHRITRMETSSSYSTEIQTDQCFFEAGQLEIEKMREKMILEAEAVWKEFDEEVKRFADEPRLSLADLVKEQRLRRQSGSGREVHRPQTSTLRLQVKERSPSLLKEVVRVKEDEKKMEVSLDTSQYRPDELSVSVSNGAITVEGKHEEKSESGHKMVSRQFIRKYSLPAGARAEDVVSNLSSDGVLVISANKSNPAIDVKINQK